MKWMANRMGFLPRFWDFDVIGLYFEIARNWDLAPFSYSYRSLRKLMAQGDIFIFFDMASLLRESMAPLLEGV